MATTMIVSPTYGDIYFDAVLKAEHEYAVTVTEHPIESGVSVSDHAFIQPEKVSLSIGMSDAMSSSAGHSLDFFQTLRDMLRLREPVTLVTRFQSYDDMLLVSMSVPDEYTIMNGIKAELTFQHVEIVTAQIVSVNASITSSKSDSDGSTKKSTDEDEEYDLWGSALNAVTEGVNFIYNALIGDSSSAGSSSSLIPTTPIDASKYKTAGEVLANYFTGG